jgi:pimeloyl-ACP methyl ester carboxylesterase
MRRPLLGLGLTAALILLVARPAAAADHLLTIEHWVPHVSTVPANAGEHVPIYVREKVRADVARRAENGKPAPVVIFVHGGTNPSAVGFDLQFRDYSWMEYLARAGYDVFAMEMNGYGRSPRPTMGDPCNVPADQQSMIMPYPLTAPCPPSYPFRLNTATSEQDELDRVVEYVRARRGIDRVALVGWSGGGFRTGTYTSLHPEKVEKLIVYASSNYNRTGPSNPPVQVPAPGFPTTIASHQTYIVEGWGADIQCEGQVEPGVQDAVWAATMNHDPVGSSWGPGVVRAPQRTLWGWNAEAAGRVRVPTLIMVGELDGLISSMRLLYEDLGTQNKVLIEIACASHQMVWEYQHRILHQASKEWLQDSAIKRRHQGKLRVDEKGRYQEP